MPFHLLAAGDLLFGRRPARVPPDLDTTEFFPKRLVEALEAKEDERAKGFRANALESVMEGLTAEGYLDRRSQLAEPEALTRVLAAANEDVRLGHIGVDEVRGVFRRFWSMTAAEEPDATLP